jgi:hypothetical protein
MAGRRHQPAKRLLGTAVGVGFCLVGAYAVLGIPALPDAVRGDRVLWYGITVILVGLVAIASSWYVDDVDGIWCRHPARTWRSRRHDGPSDG